MIFVDKPTSAHLLTAADVPGAKKKKTKRPRGEYGFSPDMAPPLGIKLVFNLVSRKKKNNPGLPEKAKTLDSFPARA